MIGMDIFAFLYLLAVAVAVSLIMYYAFKIKVPGKYFSALIWAWIGAWIGTPVMGKWWETISYVNPQTKSEVYIVPAILGAIVVLYIFHSFALCMGWKYEEEKKTTKK